MATLTSRFSKEVYDRNAEIYKILANPKRLAILNAIRDKEATVTEISDMLGARKANTSQHLMILRHFGLVTIRKSGKFVYYKIIHPGLVEPCQILKDLHDEKKLGKR